MTFSLLNCLKLIKICSDENMSNKEMGEKLDKMNIRIYGFFRNEQQIKVYILKTYRKFYVVIIPPKNLEKFSNKRNVMRDSHKNLILFNNKKLEVNAFMYRQFKQLIDSVRNSIKHVLELLKFYPTPFQFMGYGVGGNIASLLCFEIFRNYVSVVPSLVTFGSSRLGNKNFTKAFNHYIEDYQRIFSQKDPIPSTPSLLNGYRHINKGICVDKYGKKKIFTKIRKREKNHDIEKYLEMMEKYSENYTDHVKDCNVNYNDYD